MLYTSSALESKLEWFALKVQSRYKEKVKESLRGKGFKVMFPQYTSVRQYSDRLKKIALPLFPGYVFCQMDQNRRLPVLITPGVEYVVGFCGRMEPIPQQQIDALESLSTAELDSQPWPYLAIGDRIRIAAGALAGVEGFLIRTQGTDRLILSIEMLQRSIAVCIERTWVQPKTLERPKSTSHLSN